jgi:hypothetical protein
MTQTKAELLQTRHQGDIRLGDADSTHYVGFKAPATVGTSLVWTLPAADGTANYLLKTDGSGNLGWVADSSTDSTKMPLAGGIFTGDVTFDGATAGRDIVFDRSDNALEFADNAKAVFGTGGDLELYFDDTNSYLYHKTGTTLILKSDGGISLKTATNEDAIACNLNGSVELYHNNVKILETLANGIAVAGKVDLTNGHLYLDDNYAARFGTGEDLLIYHDGSHSYIKDQGTGDLKIISDGGQVVFQKGTSETLAAFATDSGCELYYDNVKKFETTAQAVKITGGIAQVVTAAGALDLDLNTSNYFTKTISGNSTFTFSNPAASGQATAFTLELTHSSGTVTWPSSVKWNGDTAPTLTTGKTHLFMFVTDDGGSRYRGSALVDYVN